MKRIFFLGSELIGYIFLALIVGRYLDSYFSLKVWGTLSCVILAYILWFSHFYRIYKNEKKKDFK